MKFKYSLPQQLIESIARGDAIAVVGAGASISHGMPTWPQLLKLLIQECKSQVPNFEDEDELNKLLASGNYMDVADACRKALNGPAYRDFIQRTFKISSRKSSPLHKAILRLPFAAIITTNFDTLIEQEVHRHPNNFSNVPVYTHRNTAHLAQLNASRGFYIFKAHGHVDDIESIVLSRGDYQNLIHGNIAFRSALSNIVASKTLVFIGYSLSDPDLNLLLEEHATVFRGFGKRHFAFLAKPGRVRSATLGDNFNITAIPYETPHSQLLGIFSSLLNKVEEEQISIDHEEIKTRSAKIPAMQQSREIIRYETRICAYLNTHIELERARFLQLQSNIAGFTTSEKNLIARSIETGERNKNNIAAMQHQLLQAQKMEAIGTLAGGIAHDFRNILAVLTAHNELVIQSSSISDQDKNHLIQVRKASEKANELIRQILAFSKGGSMEYGPVNLQEVIEDTVKFLRSTIPDLVRINFNTHLPHAIVKADRTQIQQVILNLCVNAAQAIGSNAGEIGISLTLLDHASPVFLKHSDHAPKALYCLAVRDTGHGMDSNTLAKIFEPFFTTKNGGTGLGLPVVHSIIKNHGGIVHVESKPNEGACFSVLIPILPTRKPNNPTQPIQKQSHSAHIVLIDDEADILELMTAMIQSAGHTVTPFDNASNAISFLRKTPNNKIIISDLVMPEMGGMEIAKLIKSERLNIPVIICSGYTIDPRRAKRAGVIRIFEKPIQISTLLDCIQDILAKQKKRRSREKDA